MRELKRAFGALRRKGQRLFGILGNEAGEIAVPDRPGYQYARVERGSERVTLMCLGNVRPRLNTAVIVEQNPLTEEFQIVGLDVETTRAAGDDPTTALFYTEPHAASHEWRRDADDCLLWLHPNQIYFLRVQPGDVSGHVVVQGGPYFVHGQLCWKRSQSDVDLTTYFPAWGAAWVMLCLDADDAITVVQAAGGVDARDIADLDVIPTGNIALAAVKLTAGAAIDFFDDIVPLWQITQFDASVLANGEVRITEDGLVVGVDYPAPTGEWHFLGGMASECGESLRGLLSVWDTDKVFLGLLDEGEDRKDALLLWGDNVADVLRFAFCHYATGFSEVGRLTYDGILTFIDTVAAGDWQAGDITLGKWAKQGLMPTFATTLDAVGHGAAWAGTVYALGVVDYTTYKDVVLAIRQETTYDKFRVAYIAELGGLEADVFSIARDGTIGVLDGATVDGVDISLHDHSGAGEGGTVAFLSLGDTPASYDGMGGKVVSVKADETGLEFTTGGSGGGGGDAYITFQARYWTVDGPLAVADEVGGVWRLMENFVVSAVTAYLYATGTAGSTIIDMDTSADGGATWTTLFTTPALRPAIAAGAADKRASSVPDVTLLYAGDLIRLNIDQVATGARGLSAQIDGEVHTMSPTLYAVTLTSADTEYSQALPAGLRALSFKARTNVAVRWAFATGKVATPTDPYETLAAGQTYFKENIVGASVTLYLASATATAGTVVEIEAWA